MKARVFLDTSAIYAIALRTDLKHSTVLRLYSKKTHSFVLHELILCEAFSLLAKRHGKRIAVRVITALRDSSRVEVVPVDADLLEAGWQRCLHYADKDWDWIDCVSFELMDRRGLREALSLDRHFAQAGFTLLVR